MKKTFYNAPQTEVMMVNALVSLCETSGGGQDKSFFETGIPGDAVDAI